MPAAPNGVAGLMEAASKVWPYAARPTAIVSRNRANTLHLRDFRERDWDRDGSWRLFVLFRISRAHFGRLLAGGRDLNERTFPHSRAIFCRFQPFAPAIQQFRPEGKN